MPYYDQFREKVLEYRLLVYIAVFLAYNVVDFYKDYRLKAVQDMDLELLQRSFDLEKMETKNIMSTLLNSVTG